MAESRITRDQALDALPVRAPGVTCEPAPGGGARVIALQPTSKLARAILRMPDAIPRKFDLDSFGLAVFNQCDGKRTVRQIVGAFAAEHKVDEAEAERAVTVFLQTLMRKGLVTMMIPK